MRRRTSIALTILGLIAASISYRILHQPGGSTSPTGMSQPKLSSNSFRVAPLSSLTDHPALAPLTAKRVGGVADSTASKCVDIVRPDLEGLSSKWLAAEDIEPEAKALFEDGFRRIELGDFREARRTLQRLVKKYSLTKIGAPAYWAIGLTFYREGETHNLVHAERQFKRFLEFFPDSEQELVRAAQIDIAVIGLELMRSDRENRGLGIIGALEAVMALQAFLEKWPDDPQACAARNHLKEIDDFLLNQRGTGTYLVPWNDSDR